MFESICVVGERGQITLPKNIRDLQRIKSKDKLMVRIDHDRLVVEKLKNKKETEKLLKEYYQKYYKVQEKIAEEWKHVSKEADAMLDDY